MQKKKLILLLHHIIESKKNNLPLYDIEVIEIPRFIDRNGQSISAKTMRNALKNKDWDTISQLVLPTTIEVLQKI